METKDLSKEQQDLLAREFSPEVEKLAAAQAAEVQNLYTTGFEKMATETADYLDKVAADAEKLAAEAEEPYKKLDENQVKEAQVKGAFIARGEYEGLLEKGAERHGDELHYFYDGLTEKIAQLDPELYEEISKVGGVKEFLSHHGKKMSGFMKSTAATATKHVKEHPKSYAAGAAGVGAAAVGARHLLKKKKTEAAE